MSLESPCIRKCQLDEDGRFCVGCWRSAAEIAAWLESTDDERTQILAAIHERQTQRQLKSQDKESHE